MTTQCTGPHELRLAGAPAHALRDRQRLEGGRDDAGQQVDRAWRRLRRRDRPATGPSACRAARARSTSTPQPRANASAACVGRPSASNAALTGGPRFSSGRSGCRSDSRRTRTARRRGVANRSTALNCRPAVRKPCSTPSANAALSVSSDFGGSSSVPISTRKSRTGAHARPPVVRPFSGNGGSTCEIRGRSSLSAASGTPVPPGWRSTPPRHRGRAYARAGCSAGARSRRSPCAHRAG